MPKTVSREIVATSRMRNKNFAASNATLQTQNMRMLKRLQESKSIYDFRKMDIEFRRSEEEKHMKRLIQSTSMNDLNTNASITKLLKKQRRLSRSYESRRMSEFSSEKPGHKISPAKVGNVMMEDSRFTEDYKIEALNRELEQSAFKRRTIDYQAL